MIDSFTDFSPPNLCNINLLQLSAVERYAMRFIEETDSIFSAEQLAAAEAEIEQQKLEWEKERLQALHLEEERQAQLAEEASEELLTFSREDSTNQVNTPRTRSRSNVQLDLWTLDVSPIVPVNQTRKTKQPSQQLDKKEKRLSCSSPPLTPYPNPNLVIRTRRASSATIGSKESWEVSNHVSEPCLVGKRLTRVTRMKRRSVDTSIEGNGPVL